MEAQEVQQVACPICFYIQIRLGTDFVPCMQVGVVTESLFQGSTRRHQDGIAEIIKGSHYRSYAGHLAVLPLGSLKNRLYVFIVFVIGQRQKDIVIPDQQIKKCTIIFIGSHRIIDRLERVLQYPVDKECTAIVHLIPCFPVVFLQSNNLCLRQS